MNWAELDQEIRQLAQKIAEKPDIIVGVVRGGLVPARLLAARLNVKDMYAVTVKKVGDSRKVTSEISEEIEGKHILLVEDILETGKSLVVAKEYLESKGASVKTACLYTMQQTEIVPDYFLNQISEVQKFPWE